MLVNSQYFAIFHILLCINTYRTHRDAVIFVNKWGTLPKQKHIPVFLHCHMQTQRGSYRYSRGLPSHVLLGRADRHALTFHRPAFCVSPVGGSYFPPGSWPNGASLLSPLNLLSACLRLLPSSTGYCINLAPPRLRIDGLPYASASSPDTRAPCRLMFR